MQNERKVIIFVIDDIANDATFVKVVTVTLVPAL